MLEQIDKRVPPKSIPQQFHQKLYPNVMVLPMSKFMLQCVAKIFAGIRISREQYNGMEKTCYGGGVFKNCYKNGGNLYILK